ncbi:MAG TPA: aromatic ring-hydroxylating dioxygenase subunit alpha [Chloroflexota bacterium]|nr:aromatic ring-hydroxylating dioxygenase subunit alpha [Chloroflexota bacterium]
MGALMRRYWVPFLLSSELPERDCPPVRVTLLGEKLVAYRDSNGQVGLLDNHCPHRGASLFFGRNEECGLRCVYHGWKFDLTGRCMDMPNEPPESNFKDKVRVKAYPCRERAGIVWAYMGPAELQPGLPEFEFLTVPEDHRYVTKRIQECNWLQALEGGLDSSHIAFLHRGNYSDELGDIYYGDPAPKFFVVPADYGLLIAARRNTSGEQYNWRNTPWMMPWYMLIPYPDGQPFGGHSWVPIDDHTCWNWTFSWRADRPVNAQEVALWDSGAHIHSKLIPGTFMPEANASNDYLIDREVQRSKRSFTGIYGSGPQDAAVQEGMGPIYDRSQEHLGASDAGVIAARRHLLRALRDPALILGTDPSTHHVRAVDMNLPRDVDFVAGTAERMRVA